MAHAFNSGIWGAEIGRSLWIPGQAGLRNEFQHSPGYTEKKKNCVKTQNKNLLTHLVTPNFMKRKKPYFTKSTKV